jgi:hypothetical protein
MISGHYPKNMRLQISLALILAASCAFSQGTHVHHHFSAPDYSLQYAVNTFAGIYKDIERTRQAREEANSKISLLKTTYNSYSSHPDTITNGWHNVVATDNLNFCRDAKVLVSDNRITDFVIDNCIHLNFTSTGTIKKAKNVVTFKNFNGEKLEIAEVYFMYDIEEPVIVAPPIEPAYVCFWTKKSGYLTEKIEIDGNLIDGVRSKLAKEPECFGEGTVSLTLPPGRYSFRAMKSGNDHEGEVELKSGECLKYFLP